MCFVGFILRYQRDLVLASLSFLLVKRRVLFSGYDPVSGVNEV